MGPKLAYKLIFLIVVPCLVLSGVLYIAIIGWRDDKTEAVEPEIVGQFPLQQDWRVQLDTSIDLPLATWKDMVFIRTFNSLYALSGEDGSIVWQRNNFGRTYQDIIFASDDLVIVPQNQNTILVLDIQTGRTIVSIPDPIDYAGIEAAAIDEQSFYLIQKRHLSVYGLDNGDVRWGGFTGTGLDIFVNSQTNEFFLVGSLDVQTFNQTTGKLLQSTRFIEYPGRFPSSNVYNSARQELLLVRGENLYIFDLSTNSIRLTVNIGKLEFYPKLVGNTLYIANKAGKIVTIDVSSGERLWELQIPDTKLLQTPNLLGEHLYTKDERTGRIYAISLSTRELMGYLQVGQRQIQTRFPEGINPVVATGRLIVPQGDRVYGYAP